MVAFPSLLYSLFAAVSPDYWLNFYKNKDWLGIIFLPGLYLHCLIIFVISISLMKHLNWGRYCVIGLNGTYLVFIIYAVLNLFSEKRLLENGFELLYPIILAIINMLVIVFILLPSTRDFFENKKPHILPNKR